MRNKQASRGLQTVTVVLTDICKEVREKAEEDFQTTGHRRKQADLLELNDLSHVSVGRELHIEMLTENCLLK